MSLEKSSSFHENKNRDFIKKENDENNSKKNLENNLLCKPIAIKQSIISNNQPINNLNKYPSVSVIYPNQPTQLSNDINKINYIKKKDSEIFKYNSNEIPSLSSEKGAFSLLQNYNSGSLINSNNIINSRKNDSGEENNKIHCTCKKTKCIKKYCECYSRGFLCFNCKCENCENKPTQFIENNNNISKNSNSKIINNKEEENNENINNKAENENTIDLIDNNLNKLIICTCSKSGCNKNYCECFKAKVKCNNKCRCIKCLNKPDDTLPLDEEKIVKNNVSTPINSNKINNKVFANSFTVHRISINLNKVQTLINIEKLDYFDSNKFLSKKRNES